MQDIEQLCQCLLSENIEDAKMAAEIINNPNSDYWGGFGNGNTNRSTFEYAKPDSYLYELWYSSLWRCCKTHSGPQIKDHIALHMNGIKLYREIL